MTLDQFNNGYWYAKDLKQFAKKIGIRNSSKLRKDELEKIIKYYLKTGKVLEINSKGPKTIAAKDSNIGLNADLPIIRFTNNKETWDFLDKQAKKIDPSFKRRQGTKYRLNRWREEQIEKNKPITYGDLAKAYVEINNSKEPRERIQGTYYMYFLEDYMKNESNATREEGLKAWHKLKQMNIPKTYEDWKKATKNSN